jgi:NitT/TauT family transport system ATP-binding protein
VIAVGVIFRKRRNILSGRLASCKGKVGFSRFFWVVLDEPLGKLDSLQKGFTALLVTHDVEEALIMATRVIVLSDRPATVKADIAVDSPYPRQRDDPKLVTLRREILGLLGLEW